MVARFDDRAALRRHLEELPPDWIQDPEWPSIPSIGRGESSIYHTDRHPWVLVGEMHLIHRETLPDGRLRLRAARCSYTFSRLQPGVLLVTAVGQEYGDLGRAPIGEVAAEAALHPPARFFIDLGGLTHVTSTVSDDWTAWFRANHASVRRVDVLTGSVLVQLTVTVSQLFARIGETMRIHTAPETFDLAVREVVPTFQRAAPV